LLQIHAMATRLILDTLLRTDECAFDHKIEQFKEIVRLAKMFLTMARESRKDVGCFASMLELCLH
jgi:hypothetical protein